MPHSPAILNSAAAGTPMHLTDWRIRLQRRRSRRHFYGRRLAAGGMFLVLAATAAVAVQAGQSLLRRL